MENQANYFFALQFAPDTCSAIETLRQGLALPGKPVPTENLHLTLAFLGKLTEMERKKVRAIYQTLRCPTINCQLDRIEYWPGPKVVTLTPYNPPQALLQFQALLVEKLEKANLAFDKRAFYPHVTLIKKGHSLIKAPTIKPITFSIDDYALLTSHRGILLYRSFKRT